jgi:predicted lipoprotein with Yx(FWY)xxD motif
MKRLHPISGLGALAPAAALILAVTLAGCGGSPGTSYGNTSPSSAAPSSNAPASSSPASNAPVAGPELKTASSSAGNIVVGANGMSVYFFTKDVKDSGKSACEGACMTLWPAVTTTSDKPAVEGVTGTIGTIPAADGKKQVTINGLPVYFFAQDTAAGDVKGQGYNNSWYLVSPSGDMIKQNSGMGY